MQLEDTATYLSLKDRVALITGGSSGIGASIVKRFCEQGSQVFFIDNDRSTEGAMAHPRKRSGNDAPSMLKTKTGARRNR